MYIIMVFILNCWYRTSTHYLFKKRKTKQKQKYSVKIASKNGNTIVSVYVGGWGGFVFVYCLEYDEQKMP